MNTTHKTYRYQKLATRIWPILTLALALAASVVPLAAQSTDASMAVKLKDTDGTKGWLLKRGTTVLASQNPNYVFEPASTIKFLHHLHAELMIQNYGVSPQQPISGTTLYAGSCPVTWWTWWTEPLEDAMYKMMWSSDNARTEAIKTYFGKDAINDTAHALGAVNTNLNHTLGCGDEAVVSPNQLTLNDATTLYRKAFTGDLLTPENRQHLWARMPNTLQALKDTATWEAAVTYGSALPKPIADNLKVAVKGGGYTLCSYLFLGGCKYYRSIAGYVEIPFQTAYGIPIPFKYTFGIFIDKATNEHNADEALKQAIAEIFRLELRKAIGTFL
jgi:Beta-lactamase enzyme family